MGAKNVKVALEIGTLGSPTEQALAREWLEARAHKGMWHTRPIGLIIIGLFVTIVGGAFLYWVGLH